MHFLVLLFLSNLFSSDMIIIVFVALLLFGGEKLPEIARGLGKGIRDFKDASDGIKREINDHINSLEEKRVETSLDNRAAATQNQLAENNGHLNESQPIVENTMPVSDSYFTGDAHTVTEDGQLTHLEGVAQSHAVDAHADSGTAVKEEVKS